MGSGNFFKAIIGSKKGKQTKGLSTAVKSKASKKKGTHASSLVVRSEDWAATRIQSAFRAYKARKMLRRLKGIARAKELTEKHPVKKQAAVTLKYLHSWSKIQSQIKARRVGMVMESRLMHKRLENQQKLEAKLHDIEVEWNGGAETKDEILGRIHQREEATIKRERALAYAFAHQWKAEGKTQWLGGYELGNTNWGWSWKERWIAVRPWEVRHSLTPKKPRSLKTVCCKSETKSNSPAKRVTSVSAKAPATLHPSGNVVLAERISKLSRGDVVVFQSPEDPNKLPTKRVVGLEGDSVSFVVDPGKNDESRTIVVPKGHVWVEGDYTQNSRDSRSFGPVPYALVQGRLLWRVWPFQDFGPIGS